MIIMENHQNFRENPLVMEMLGIGLVKISQIDVGAQFNVLFQKGIGVPLIQNVIELYKKEIIHKKQGNSIIPLEKFTIFIHYFTNENHNQDILVIIYMEEKNS